MRPLRVAFVGVKRKYQELDPDYRDVFTKTHLELPYYFARDGKMSVIVTTVDWSDNGGNLFVDWKNDRYEGGGSLRHITEKQYQEDFGFHCGMVDVVVHWRKWFPEFFRGDAINVINCQDHSFGQEWQQTASQAFRDKQLHGILCFPTWHKRNLLRECPWLPEDRAIDGLTLGVDTDIYKPAPDKDPYQLLWASDPGRGLYECVAVFAKIFQMDKRFRLNVCYPDYCQHPQVPTHPGVINHRNVSNGPKLWELFNRCGVLPYTSNFMEPSSRAHRQAQAAGSLVLYPPDRGTPSELIGESYTRGRATGLVSPIMNWAGLIREVVNDGSWKDVGEQAREYAISENWAVQANRFRDYFEKEIEKR